MTTRRRESAPMQGNVGRAKAYDHAYAEVAGAVLSSLSAVDSLESSRRFVAQAAKGIQEASAEVPEFYVGEFFNVFKDAAVARVSAEVAQGTRTHENVRAEAAAAATELQTRLYEARKAYDREAEHEVWREREARQLRILWTTRNWAWTKISSAGPGGALGVGGVKASE
jgi:hypothetical protein